MREESASTNKRSSVQYWRCAATSSAHVNGSTRKLDPLRASCARTGTIARHPPAARILKCAPVMVIPEPYKHSEWRKAPAQRPSAQYRPPGVCILMDYWSLPAASRGADGDRSLTLSHA